MKIRCRCRDNAPDYSGNIVKKDKDNIIERKDKIKVSVPAGTLKDDTILHISKPDKDKIPHSKGNPIGLNPIGLYLEIELESGQRELNKPATISIPYEDKDNDGIVDGTKIPESNLRVNILDGTMWKELLTTIDHQDNIVTATTTRFTIFGVFGISALGQTLDDVRVYPNPLKPDSGTDRITFDRLPLGTGIRIYTTSGELVRVQEGITTGYFNWDTRNDHGERVASGVYIYVATDSQGGIKRGKMVIIR